MIRGIDHLVIACADPDAAATAMESSVGIACTGGGRHERFGTRNRIAWLADGSYLELIGIEDPSLVATTPVGLAAQRVLQSEAAGLATYALVTDDLEGTAASLRAAGSGIGPVQAGSRRREDGELVEWLAAFPDDDLRPTSPPFLIEHAYRGAEWGEAALEERARFRHPIGSPVTLVRLDLAAEDPPSRAGALADQLGLDVRVTADLAVASIGRHAVRFVARRQMPVPVVITLAAEVETARTAELLGMRFDVDPVDVAVPNRVEPSPAS